MEIFQHVKFPNGEIGMKFVIVTARFINVISMCKSNLGVCVCMCEPGEIDRKKCVYSERISK